MKKRKKKLDEKYTSVLRTVLNIYWKQHPAVRLFVSHLQNHLSKTNKTCSAVMEM